jgi:hypothetical protein
MKRLVSLLFAAGLMLTASAALADHPCDFDGNGAFDQADKDVILAAQGTQPGDPGYIPQADLDGDEVISLVDVSLCLSAQ